MGVPAKDDDMDWIFCYDASCAVDAVQYMNIQRPMDDRLLHPFVEDEYWDHLNDDLEEIRAEHESLAIFESKVSERQQLVADGSVNVDVTKVTQQSSDSSQSHVLPGRADTADYGFGCQKSHRQKIVRDLMLPPSVFVARPVSRGGV